MRQGESLEFKEAKNNFDRAKLFKYVVALANEGGGHLVLGMTDKKPREVVGTSAFRNTQDLKSDVRDNTGLSIQVFEKLISEKRLLVIRAPSRPNGTAYNYKGAYFMRCGSELVPMSEDRLREIFSESRSWDAETLREGLSAAEVCEELDLEALHRFLDVPLPANEDEAVGKLVALRLAAKNGKSFSLTNAAAVTLAKDLNNFPELSRKAPRLIVYNGNPDAAKIEDCVTVAFSSLLDLTFIKPRCVNHDVNSGSLAVSKAMLSLFARSCAIAMTSTICS